mmetsp:Transcript_57227/g.138269  ORF Transcript_57227/g.138269 Transcript_57227/m.138269 type:complete len:410 (-) Transcript_57227:12-1241(-)
MASAKKVSEQGDPLDEGMRKEIHAGLPLVELDSKAHIHHSTFGVGSSGVAKFTDKQSKLLILYMGGTMGMKPDEKGVLHQVPGYLTEQVERMLAEQHDSFLPTVTVKEYPSLLHGCDMNPDHWVLIANDLERNYDEYDGFVIIMGTDTMAYTASALSFMLENLAKTVILTGSQVPYCKTFSDARRNLLATISLACALDIAEVCVFFDDKLFRGNRTRKADAGAFDAFSSPNFPPLATLGLSVQVNSSLLLPQPRGRFKVFTKMDSKMVVVKYVPIFDVDALLRLANQGTETCKALVLELYGTGNAPKDPRLLQTIKRAKEVALLVVVTSQCARGAVMARAYAVNEHLSELGVIPTMDMTTEATCAKIAYLFGKGLAPEQVAAQMMTNLRGECGSAEHINVPGVRGVARL